MDSVRQSGMSSIRKARLLGVLFLVYAIVMPFIILLIPESELPGGTSSPEVISWLMIILMPMEILLIYLSFRHFRKRTDLGNIMAPAVLMYTFATIPSIYAFVIGFIGSNLRPFAIPLGLVFSLVGFWLTSMYLSKLWETTTTDNQ
ncbi:MAG: hypothetical protein ACXAEF_06910 [Candidatus Thorarchaeota archaeon]|jgi:hypothetical protein